MSKQRHIVIKTPFLLPEERASHLPEDTKKTPFMVVIKGKVLSETAGIFSIKTATGRAVEGTLFCENPAYTHSFGHYVEELETIKAIIQKEAEGIV